MPEPHATRHHAACLIRGHSWGRGKGVYIGPAGGAHWDSYGYTCKRCGKKEVR